MNHRVALIGLGMAVTPHAQSLVDLAERAEVTMAFSRSASRRQSFASQFAFPLVDDLDRIWGNRLIDTVAILTPPNSHLELVRRAAAAGKHVLLEKPLEVSMARAEELVSIGEKHGITVGVMLQHRFKPAAERLKQILEKAELGRIVGASVRVPWWRPQSYYDVEGRGTLARDGGGVLISQAIHTLDLALSLAGPVARVSGFAGTGSVHRMETEDIVSAAIRFSNGAIGTIEATTASYPGGAERIDIIGAAGTAALIGSALEVRWLDGRSEDRAPDAVPPTNVAAPMAFPHTYHLAAWRDFFDCLESGRAPRVSARDALAVHYLIDAILESAAGDGSPVTVRSGRG